jgi:hypothetical protein
MEDAKSVWNSKKDIFKILQHLAINEVIILFKGKVIFWQYIPKKRKRSGIKIYKPCDETG